jgi:hypothetical protein
VVEMDNAVDAVIGQQEVNMAEQVKIPYRPNTSKYRTHVEPYLKDIEKWISKGIPDCTIRQKLGISKDAWLDYKKVHSGLSELYDVKKELLVIGLENSLYKKAHGYNVTEITKEPVKDPKTGKCSLEVTKEVAKHVPPDSTALIFSLSNLDPDNWKQRNQGLNVQINNNNFQLPQVQALIDKEMEELKKLEAIDITAFKVVENKDIIAK